MTWSTATASPEPQLAEWERGLMLDELSIALNRKLDESDVTFTTDYDEVWKHYVHRATIEVNA